MHPGTSHGRAAVFSFSVALTLPHAALAQVPAGPEFAVNTHTTGGQFLPSTGADATGNYVVTWTGDVQDGNSYGVFARLHAPDGQPQGAEFQVNTYTTGTQSWPRVSVADRSFVIVWVNAPGPPVFEDISGQRYLLDGTPLGAPFMASAPTHPVNRFPAVAASRDGSFMVVWQYAFSPSDVDGRLFDSAGQPIGGTFRVNSYLTGDQARAAIAGDGRGGYVVVWTSDTQEGPLGAGGVYGQRFAGGAPVGPEFHVNSYTPGPQLWPAVAMNVSGEFVVAFSSLDGSSIGIFARRFDAQGVALGAEFLVNTYTTGIQEFSTVAADAAGNFVVTWSDDVGGSADGIFAQRFSASGARRGSQFQVNSITTDVQVRSVVASDWLGNFLVAWENREGADEIAAQRFGGLLATALAVDPPDAGGNGVLDPGETGTVRPSWRNVNGAPQTFSAVAPLLTGPAGPTYTVLDGLADYGTVANGATASCLATADCFSVSVTGARPATHWDATLAENIQPDAHGQVKAWTVHVGGSFGDVAAGSGFYRFVETILHRAVTGGCTATSYCPQSPTTREQMAVFALVSKEGAGYVPPACGTPMFGDVPTTSPFCRWIEELARRGVVGGCGGGNYCPTAEVTREQMSIFALRTLEGPAYVPPACGTPIYSDVPATSPFCRYIEELTRRGVVSGCGNGAYCPSAAVTREQMSVFLSVTFGLQLYGP